MSGQHRRFNEFQMEVNQDSRPVARIDFWGGLGSPKVDLLAQKVDFLNLTPLTP